MLNQQKTQHGLHTSNTLSRQIFQNNFLMENMKSSPFSAMAKGFQKTKRYTEIDPALEELFSEEEEINAEGPYKLWKCLVRDQTLSNIHYICVLLFIIGWCVIIMRPACWYLCRIDVWS